MAPKNSKNSYVNNEYLKVASKESKQATKCLAPKKSKNSFVKKLLADDLEYQKVANKVAKCHKLKNQVWELSVMCDVIVYLIVIGPDGKVSKENLEEVKSILREYWLKKRLERSSDLLEVVLEEIMKRTVDIDRNWVPTEELRDMWNSLESQLEAVIEKTSGVVRDNETTIGDMRKSMMQIDQSFSDTSV